MSASKSRQLIEPDKSSQKSGSAEQHRLHQRRLHGTTDEQNIFNKIERLATLRDRGIFNDDELPSKKAERLLVPQSGDWVELAGATLAAYS